MKDSITELKIVGVWMPLPIEHPYFYLVPKEMIVTIGSIVRVPLRNRSVIGIVIEETVAIDITNKKKLRPICTVLEYPPLKDELIRFIRFVASYTLSSPGLVIRMVLRVLFELNSSSTTVQTVRFTGLYPKRITPARARVIELLQKQNTCWTRAHLARRAKTTVAVINKLQNQGILEPDTTSDNLIPSSPNINHKTTILENNQLSAVNLLNRIISDRKFSVCLLNGVTGSGKTEVYFEAIAKILQQGRQVLILLPEIALTHQFLDRFKNRFDVFPAEWHSNLTIRQKERIWRNAAEGRIQVVAGARSALFLPFRNLGLIVVDEEHDTAYKQEDKIFYNARDMAVARGYFANILVILSSATPSFESLVNVERGRYYHVYLPTRFSYVSMPELQAIDMRKNRLLSGCFLSNPLLFAMKEILKKKQQVLLFLNRRGYAPLTLCRACGYRFACPDCSSWLVEHRYHKYLLCHHCGYRQPTLNFCPECAVPGHLVAYGPGVERIAEETYKRFSDARVLILSTDIICGVQKLRNELESIKRGEVDIIIGTQLVTKGHHFPNITLVGVIDIDVSLSSSDPRAAERTFQLLSQVTGRAGRTGKKSYGLIQTYQPEHPVIQAIISNDFNTFYTREISERKIGNIPPFGRLAAIIVSGKEKKEVESHARLLRRFAPTTSEIAVLGPAEAPLSMIRKRYRFRLLIHGPRHANLQFFIRVLLKNSPPPRRSVKIQIDIDPQSFF